MSRTPYTIDARNEVVQKIAHRVTVAILGGSLALLPACVAGGGNDGVDLSFGGDDTVKVAEDAKGATNFPVWGEGQQEDEAPDYGDPSNPHRQTPDEGTRVPGVNLADKDRAAKDQQHEDPAGQIPTQPGNNPEDPNGNPGGPTEPAPQPPPEEVECETNEDCPVVAGGCVLQQCQMGEDGKGICVDAAFVCECVPGFDDNCDDGDTCTTDTCGDDGACEHDASGICNDGNVCTSDACENSKCTFTAFAEGDACEDGNICTIDQVCTAGSCAGGAVVDCDDGDACTFDLCDPVGGCQHKATGSCGS